MDNLNSKKSQIESEGAEITEDQLCFEVMGGKKKGKVYGFGSAAKLYFASAEVTNASTESNAYAPVLLTQALLANVELKAKLEINDTQLASTKERLKKAGRTRAPISAAFWIFFNKRHSYFYFHTGRFHLRWEWWHCVTFLPH